MILKFQLEKQIDVAEEIFNTYPILVYPCRIYDHGAHTGQLRPPRKDQMCPGTKWGKILPINTNLQISINLHNSFQQCSTIWESMAYLGQ